MSASFTIKPEHNLVISLASGILTFGDIAEHRRRLLGDPKFSSRFNQLIDFSAVTSIQIGSGQIEQLAREHLFSRESRRALLVNSQLHFGLCRMFATYSDLAGESKVVVLKEFHQAIAWLDVPETVVHAALAELRAQTEDARGK